MRTILLGHCACRLVLLSFLALVTAVGPASAQGFRPPPFIGGIPGVAQMQAIALQRHQARTLLYREALEELRKNPQAADVPECPPGVTPVGRLCLARAEASSGEEAAKISPVGTAATGTRPAEAKPVVEAPPTVRRRLALLIGNNDYQPPIPPLETPLADVRRMAQILRSRFGFEPRVIENAGKAQIIEAFNRIALEAQPEDSVFLFYAGHGYLMEKEKMGFWIPLDASVKTAANWISNTDIAKLLAAIRARQLILVSDSCFSGSLTREQRITQASAIKPDEVLRRRSVLVFSSGDDEPVTDEGKDGHSLFAWNLMRTLEATRGITPGYEIWREVHAKVIKEYPQHPQYGAVLTAGHVEGGEYLFAPEL